MSLLYVTVFILLLYGSFTLFELNVSDILDAITSKRGKNADKAGEESGKKKKKRFDLVRHREKIEAYLKESSSKMTWEKYLRVVAACTMLGFAFGMSINNTLLAIFIAPCMAILPSVYLQIRHRAYRRTLQMQMEQALAVITNNYCTVNDVYHAVADVIKTTDMPMKGILTSFCASIDTNESVEDALRDMREKIDDVHWRRWIDRMIKCQSNSTQRSTLKQIPQEISNQRQMQMTLDTDMRQIWVKHFAVAGLSLISMPFVNVLDPSWGAVLMDNPVGKAAVAFNVLLVITATVYAYTINKPLYLSGEGSEKKKS